MSAQCDQHHGAFRRCELDASHRNRGEHHLASDGKGGFVEWPCYDLPGYPELRRVSYCRSARAFELFGDAPLMIARHDCSD